jgi:hypothetical protein
MSWIVQTLIRSSPTLKEKSDLDSDEYNNLLLIEKKIEDLSKSKVLTPYEVNLLKRISNGWSLKDLSTLLNLNRITIAKDIKKACEVVAYYLGGEFTDVGYLDYMQNKYELSENEIDGLKEYMTGIHSKKLMRKPKNVKII